MDEGRVLSRNYCKQYPCSGLRQMATFAKKHDVLRQPRQANPCKKAKKHRERNIKGCFTGVLLFRFMLCIFTVLARCTESLARLTFV